MLEYHKINTVFKRDEKTKKIIIGEYSTPEFEYLKNCLWEFSEKIDGTNIRVCWDWFNETIAFRGRTNNAQIPQNLLTKLYVTFPKDMFKYLFPNVDAVMFGEGYGEKIQNNIYKITGVDFILFDVNIKGWWLERENVNRIAEKFNIKSVPILCQGTIDSAISMVSNGFNSSLGDCKAEGLVLRPSVELFARDRKRVIAKLKHRDF
jgi:ATP-dependent RNA circularization protein (DNA/RNA ligase family)